MNWMLRFENTFAISSHSQQYMIAFFVTSQMRSMQHTYAQQELKLESMNTQLAKVPELGTPLMT
jgi:hypothetical protein